MRLLDTDGTAGVVTGLVHLETQRAARGIDLTVDRIARVRARGSLDFGGSEFEPAGIERIEPELADPGDDYGWWELDPGTYLVTYNERLEIGGGDLATIHPLPRLLRAGASHPAFVPEPAGGPLEVLLSVGDAGCRLKENCRISRLLVLEEAR